MGTGEDPQDKREFCQRQGLEKVPGLFKEQHMFQVLWESNEKDKAGKGSGENITEIKECYEWKVLAGGHLFLIFRWELCFKESIEAEVSQVSKVVKK